MYIRSTLDYDLQKITIEISVKTAASLHGSMAELCTPKPNPPVHVLRTQLG